MKRPTGAAAIPGCPRWPQPPNRWLTGLCALLLLTFLASPSLPGARAEALKGPGASPAALSSPNGSPPTGDSNAGDAGSFQLGKVRILGVPVLTVATATVAADGQGPDASTRAQVIEGNLALLYQRRQLCSSGESLAETFLEWGFLHGKERACAGDNLGLQGEPAALNVEVVKNGAGPTRLVARVAGRAQPLPLLTVTNEDVRLNGIGADLLAQRWRRLLERRLRFARELMRPESLRRRLALVIKVELALAIASPWCWASGAAAAMACGAWRRARSWAAARGAKRSGCRPCRASAAP